MSSLIVTTVKDRTDLTRLGEGLARELGCPFVPRLDRSFEALQREYGHSVTVVAGEQRIVARCGGQEFFFHPSMALLRLMNHLKGQTDRMAAVMGIEPGMKVLDCTMGFATDALVASFLAGPEGKVAGLEGSAVVCLLVSHGLRQYRVKIHSGLDPLKAEVLGGLPEACSRIEVVRADHRDFLASVSAKSFDIVYFDPMFRKPCENSASIAPLRELAVPDPLDADSIREACRVAKFRVVLKEGRYSREFQRLGFHVAPGGKYSEIAFGVIEVD